MSAFLRRLGDAAFGYAVVRRTLEEGRQHEGKRMKEREKEKTTIRCSPKAGQFQREVKRMFYVGWKGVLRLLFLIYCNGSLGIRRSVGFCDAGALLAGVYCTVFWQAVMWLLARWLVHAMLSGGAYGVHVMA